MKTFLKAAAVALLAALPAAAIVMPMRIPFQGKLIDPATNAPRNGTFTMTFKIWDAPSGGNQLFTENQPVTVVNGQFTAQIGTVTYLNADMLSGTSAYLGVQVSPDVTEMTPRQPLSMSPYAYTSVQLASDKVIRINSGITYSTFTAGGNLTLQYGITGTTVTFANITSTGVGAFGIVTSSGINMGDGTLKLAANSKGIDASGTGIVATTATFATITSTGVGSVFGLTVSSGITMNDGVLKIAAASDGIDASGTGISASTGVFTSSVTAKQFFGIGATTAAIKAADLNRTSNAVLDDNELSVPIGANQTYTIYGMLKSSSTSATPDIRIAFNAPAGCVIDIAYRANNGTLTTLQSGNMRDVGVNTGLIPIGASIANSIMVMGSVVNGGTAGFLTLQWGQNTTNATATTMTAGSFFAATRIK